MFSRVHLVATLLMPVPAWAGDPEACEQGDAYACHALGEAAEAEGDRDGSRGWYLRACTPEHPSLCLRLEEEWGEGAKVIAKAIKACEKDDAEVCNELGVYRVARGEYTQAAARYVRACELEFEAGCRNAGALYAGPWLESGSDPARATMLFRRSCEDLGDWRACTILAGRVRDGLGVTRDTAGAVAFLRERCDRGRGSHSSCDELASWLEEGRGVPADPEAAIDLYRKTCTPKRDRSCRALARAVLTHESTHTGTGLALSEACTEGSESACLGVAGLELLHQGRFEGSRVLATAHEVDGWAEGLCAWDIAEACAIVHRKTEDERVRLQVAAHLTALTAPRPRVEPGKPLPWAPDEGAMRACLLEHVQFVASQVHEGRAAGSPGGRAVAEHVHRALQSLGLQVQRQPVEIPEDHFGGAVTGENVLSVLPGRGALADEVLVVGAHFDHLGRDDRGALHPGADDNASGTAGMLCIATSLIAQLAAAEAHRTVVFAGFDAEERGLLGSQTYVASPPHPLTRTVGMLNLDMIGRLEDTLTVKAEPTTWAQAAADAAVLVGIVLEVEPAGRPGSSDDAPFARSGVPALGLFTGRHGDYHRPTDTTSRLNFDGLVAITRMGAAIVADHPTGTPPPKVIGPSCNEPWMVGFGVGLDLDLQPPHRVTCVPQDSLGAAFGLEVGDELAGWSTPRWPVEPATLEVQRGEACWRLQAGRDAEPCIGTP